MAGYIGNKAVGLNVTTGDILGDVGVGGVVTANAGVVVDNFTLDGTTLALSSGNLIIDSEAGDIILDAHGHDYILKTASSAELAVLGDNTSGDFFIRVGTQDKDIIFKGDDGGSAVTALTLDMSDAGAATLSNGLTLTDGNLTVASGHGIDFSATGDGAGTDTSELLDDYEEGTFTPAFTTTNTGFSSLGYSHQNGFYTKVGRKVSIHIQLIVNTTPSGANGNLLISGLPYAGSSSAQHGPGGISFYNNITSETNQSSAMVFLDGASTVLNVAFQEFSGAAQFTLTASTTLHNANPRLTCQLDYFI